MKYEQDKMQHIYIIMSYVLFEMLGSVRFVC